MIHEVEGDILFSKAQVIAHGVAPMDPMSTGLARALHERFPNMHKDFHHWCKQQHPQPGESWMWGGPDGVRVVCLLTQSGGYGHGGHPGPATLTLVNHTLRSLFKMVKKERFTSLALPRLATGVGGLEWDDVRPILRSRLEELEIPVYVYTTYRAGHQATEPGI